jgi:hypothetical protein
MAEVDRSTAIPPSTSGLNAAQIREIGRYSPPMGATATTQTRAITPDETLVRRGPQ